MTDKVMPCIWGSHMYPCYTETTRAAEGLPANIVVDIRKKTSLETERKMGYLGLLVSLSLSILGRAILAPLASAVFAQDQQPPQFNIAHTLSIKDTAAVDGDIMSLGDERETLVRSKVTNDEKIYGVIITKPVMVYRTRDTLPVARTGEVYANVTTLGGEIKVGDFITSSTIPGKGMKASDLTGYMVGIALESFDGKSGTPLQTEGKTVQSGKIKIAVGIGPASPVQIKAAGGIMGTLRQMATALLYNISTSKQLERLIRYVIAALVALTTIFVNFRTFGRNITKGIEAIGRNPLARVSIQSMIVVNVILIAVVSLGGIGLALAILSL